MTIMAINWACTAGACMSVGVPEMSYYAGVGFLGLALLFGWRLRRKYRPATV